MAADYALVMTAGDSDWQTYEDWVGYAKDKGSVVVGGIGTVNVDYIVQQMIADAEGYEIEYVPFNEEGQLQTSLLSGAIDTMISNPGSIMGQIEGGQMTPLVFTGTERLDALPDVPTSEEVGVSDIPSMPRGLILPPDAPEEAQEWWIDTMKEVVTTDEWQAYLDDNFLIKDELWGDDFETYLEETQGTFEDDLDRAGRTVTLAHADSTGARAAGRAPAWVRPKTVFLAVVLVVLAVYTEMGFGLEWRTAAGRIGPGFFPRHRRADWASS